MTRFADIATLATGVVIIVLPRDPFPSFSARPATATAT
jgi:hypothetical protein